MKIFGKLFLVALVLSVYGSAFAGDLGIKRKKAGGGAAGDGTTGDLTLNTSSGNFLSVSGSQTVTGGANLKVSSFTSIGVISSSSGFSGGGSTFTSVSISSLQTRGVNYNFPPADGAADDVLKTAGNGQLSWGTAGAAVKLSRLVVGTAAAQNVDIVSSNWEGLAAAVSSINALGGGTFYVREGTYTWSSSNFGTVVISSQVHVIADSNAVFTRKSGPHHALTIFGKWTGGTFEADALGTANTCFMLLNGAGILENFTFSGMSGNSNAAFQVIGVTGTAVLIRNGEFRDNALAPGGGGSPRFIFAAIGSSYKISGCRFFRNTNGTAAIMNQSTNAVLISDNQIYDNTFITGDILIDRSSGSLITGNYFNNSLLNTASGIYFTPVAADMTMAQYVGTVVSGNVFANCTNCIYVNSSNTDRMAANLNFLNNVFFRPLTSSINLDRATTGTIEDSFIHGNVVASTGTFLVETAASVRTKKRDNVAGSITLPDTASD